MFKTAISQVNVFATQKGISIEKDVGFAKVLADSNMLKTVIRNLLSNAIKYSPKGGNIVLSNYEQDNNVLFVVKDYGIGIEKDYADRLFSDCKIHPRKGTNQESGTGLGLHICKDFVVSMGGKIWVDSTPGKGSSFYFTLPKP